MIIDEENDIEEKDGYDGNTKVNSHNMSIE